MRFRIKKVSDLWENEDKPCSQAFLDGDKWYVELNTLEDLINLKKNVDEDLILRNSKFYNGNLILTYED